MAVNIPAATQLHTSTANTIKRSDIGSPSNLTVTKSAGNLPLSTNATQFQSNDSSPSSTDCGVLFPFTSVDVSTDTKILVWSFQFNAPNRIQVRDLANQGISVRIASGSGSSNYKKYHIGGHDTPLATSQAGINAFVIDLNDTSNDSTTGTFDNTDVQAYGLAVRRQNIVGTDNSFVFMQRAHLFDTAKNGTNIVKFTGTSDFDDIITAVLGNDYTDKIGGWVQKLSDTYFIPVAFQIGDSSTLTNFNDNGSTVVSPSSNSPGDPRYRLSTQGTRVYVDLRNNAADTCTLTGTYLWGVASPWDLDVSNLSTITITGATFTGMGDFTCGSSVSGAARFNLDSSSAVIIKGADLDGSTINGDCELQGSSVSTLTNINITDTLDFDTAGTYTLDACDINEVTNSSGGTVVLNLSNGTSITTNTGPNITLNNAVTVKVTVLDTSGSPVEGARVYLEAGATGPLTQGDVILNTTTNASGIAQDTGFNYSSDQSLQNSKVRRGTSTPLYIQATVSGTITSTGFETTVTMVSDE